MSPRVIRRPLLRGWNGLEPGLSPDLFAAISFPAFFFQMEIRNLAEQAPFTTADGSIIRSILDRANSPVQRQSLAEASLPPGGATQRHHHKRTEEIYFILEGRAEMEVTESRGRLGRATRSFCRPRPGT